MSEHTTETAERETRARRRIRQAVESRGYSVLSMEWEPWYDAGEKSGIGGGWTVLTDAPWHPNTNYGDEVMGLSVEEVLADIDWTIHPADPCGCIAEGERAQPRLGSRYKGMPETPIHSPECRWHIAYRLSWWPSENPTPPEGHPCGHAERTTGCGGCDPAAIEFVITDEGERRPFDAALDMNFPPGRAGD